MKRIGFLVAIISMLVLTFSCSKKEDDLNGEENNIVNASAGTFKATINGEPWNAMFVSANESQVGGKKSFNIIATSEKESFSISILEFKGVGEYRVDGFNHPAEVIVVYTDSLEYAFTSFAEDAKCTLRVHAASNDVVEGSLQFSGVEKGKNTNRKIEITGEFTCTKPKGE